MELTNQHLLEAANSHQELVVATVLGSIGSAPRHGGSGMVVLADASIIGTVGGGALEGRVIELAGVCLKEKASRLEQFRLTEDSSARLGMTCGGDVEVLLEYIDTSEALLTDFYASLELFTSQRRRGQHRTYYQEGRVAHLLSDVDGKSISGYCHSLKGGLDLFDATVCHGWESFVQELMPPACCVIFGCGHVGVEVAFLAQRCDFEVIAIDDREEFADWLRFPDKARVICCPFEQAWNRVVVDEESYLVIVTRGHQHDEEVLRRALQTRARYIGMIGSRRKVAGIIGHLEEEGFAPPELARVCAPIGLSIGAETPAEIAVSILGEMIQRRRGHER